MKDKRTAAEHIFCSVGLIGNMLIAEAQEPYRARRPAKKRRRAALLLAAMITLSLMLSVFMGSFIIAQIGNLSIPDPVRDDLHELLLKAESTGAAELYDGDEISLFDGEETLIWRSEGDEQYRVLGLGTALRGRSIKQLISKHGGELTSSEAEKLGYEVWISLGDGTVVSPYLKSSDGNVGRGELFSYTPEVIPGTELENIIRDVIS